MEKKFKEDKEFRKWQIKFYNSKEWKDLRNEVREDRGMRCEMCGKLIRGKSIVDHIREITPKNKFNVDITLNRNNLQLLCLDCHNKKTFKGRRIPSKINFDIEKRKDVNLFEATPPSF